jgi:hypothetical protein
MVFLIIILLAGFFALTQIFKSKDKFAKVINGVYAAGIAISFVPVPQIAIDGYYLFAIGNLMVILYAFSDDGFSKSKQAILIIMGAIQLLASVFVLNSYPFEWLVSLMGIITLGCYVFILTKDIKNYKNEIGFLSVLAADAFIKVAVVMSSLYQVEG